MSTLVEEYRKARKPNIGTETFTGKRFTHVSRAVSALWQARAEIALQQAEDEGRIRFRWVADEMYVPENSGDPQWGDKDLAIEQERLADGRYEALGCIVQVPNLCPHCKMPIEENAAGPNYWQDAGASLWGIVIDTADTYNYRREVERDLACEAEVIEVPAVLV